MRLYPVNFSPLSCGRWGPTGPKTLATVFSIIDEAKWVERNLSSSKDRYGISHIVAHHWEGDVGCLKSATNGIYSGPFEMCLYSGKSLQYIQPCQYPSNH